MTPSITSDPPASDITLFSLLGLGALTRNTNANAPLTAGMAGRSLLFQSVSRLLNSSALSLFDSFAISPDAGDLDKTGDPGTKVSFEKRISNNVRILVIYNTRDSKNRVSLEWQVTPDWVLQFTRDQLSNEYDVQARFRRRYDGRWAWGTRGRNPFAMLTSFNTSTASVPAPPPITIATTTVAAPAGAIVTSVGFSADSGVDTSAFNQYVAVKVGEPLSIRNVQTSVKSLFATGNFRDIRVDSTPSGNGLGVVFALYTNFRVSSIDFDGLSGPDRDRALRTLTFHLGDVLSLNAVDHGAVAVQDLLKRSGYLDATVDPETTFVRAQSRASVAFHVTRGPQATVGTVTIDGNTSPFTPQQLIDQMKRGPGKSFDLDEARIDADRMRQWLLRKEYRKASVRYVSNTYDSCHAQSRVALQRDHRSAREGRSHRRVAPLAPRHPSVPSQPAVQRRCDRARGRSHRHEPAAARFLQRHGRHRRGAAGQRLDVDFPRQPGTAVQPPRGDVHRQCAGLRQNAAGRRLDLGEWRNQGLARLTSAPSAGRHARAARGRPHHARVVLPAAGLPDRHGRHAGREHERRHGCDDDRLPDCRGAADDGGVRRDRRERAGCGEGPAEAGAERRAMR